MFVHLLVSAIILGLATNEPPACEELGPHVRLAIVQDLTRSIGPTETPRMTLGDLQGVIRRLRQRCGPADLAVGVIVDRVEGIKRLSISAPSIAPPPPVKHANPFRASIEAERHRRKMQEYLTKRKAWEEETERNASLFLSKVSPMLMRDLAGRTEIFNLMRQIQTFFDEPPIDGRSALNLFVAISDGADNVNARGLQKFDPSITAIVVNGVGTVGIFDPLDPKVFGSIAAAFRFVLGDVSN